MKSQAINETTRRRRQDTGRASTLALRARNVLHNLDGNVPLMRSDLNKRVRPKRAALTPIPEGWRRYVLFGCFAIGVVGVLMTLGATYLLPRVLPYLR